MQKFAILIHKQKRERKNSAEERAREKNVNNCLNIILYNIYLFYSIILLDFFSFSVFNVLLGLVRVDYYKSLPV